MHDPRVLREIVKLTNDKDSFIRFMAIRVLFEYGRDGITQLCALLHHENAEVRRTAVMWLSSPMDEGLKPTIIEALLATLHDPDAEVRAGVLAALVYHQDPRTREACRAALHDPDAQVRLAAVNGLREDDPQYLTILGEQLTDADLAIRTNAAVTLAGFDDARGADTLLSTLQQPNPPVDEFAALVRLQEPQAIPLLIKQLHIVDKEYRPAPFDIETDDSSGNTLDAVTNNLKQAGSAPTLFGRIEALAALQQGMTGGMALAPSITAEALSGYGEKAVAPLIAALHDPSPTIGSGAGLALGLIGDPRALQPLITALNDPQLDVRSGAIAGLAILEDVRAVPPLLAALRREKNNGMRWWILKALTEFRDPEILTALLPLCRDRDIAIRRIAVDAVRSYNDPRVLPTMLAALKDRNADIREEAASGGPWADDARALKALVRALGDSDGRIALNSADTLRKLAAPGAQPLLLAAVHSANPLQRLGAITALSAYRDPQVVAVLLALLEEKNPILREEAIESLKMVIGVQDLPHLLPLLSTLPSSADREHLVRILGAAGGAAVAPLAELAQDESPDIRQAAAESLGLTGDARAVDPLLPLLDDQ